MNRIKRVKNENYTTISNVFLTDKQLSLKSKGFMAVIMGLKNDWDFSIMGICTILKENKTSIYSTINELKELGYCKVNTIRNNKGVIIGNEYLFLEDPNIDNPHTENPHTENQPQLNTNTINNLYKQVLIESNVGQADSTYLENNLSNIKIEKEERKKVAQKKESVYPFHDFWNDYGKKIGKDKVGNIYQKISETDRILIKDHLPKYVASTKDVIYRKNPQTYLNQKSWNDEIITSIYGTNTIRQTSRLGLPENPVYEDYGVE